MNKEEQRSNEKRRKFSTEANLKQALLRNKEMVKTTVTSSTFARLHHNYFFTENPILYLLKLQSQSQHQLTVIKNMLHCYTDINFDFRYFNYHTYVEV